MKKRYFILFLFTFLSIGCLLFLYVRNARFSQRNDITQFRRVVHIAEDNYPDFSKDIFKGYSCPFTILDKNSQVLYQSMEETPTDLEHTLLYGDYPYPYTHGTILFCPRLAADSSQPLTAFQNKISLFILLAFFICGLLAVAYYAYLHFKVLLPFQKLNRFAREVARGNLDFPLEMDQNHIFGTFTESFDLMRDELASAKKREFLAAQEKKEMIASLSHDIRTPVTSIQVISEFLYATAADEDTKKRLSTIQEKTEQINLLITDLFHSTLEELEALSITPKEYYSSELAAIFQEADFYHQLKVKKEIPDCLVCYDKLRLSQIAGNLLYNAYKYGKPPVTLTLDLKADYLRVLVKDSGNGVSEDDLPFLFHKFYRGKNAEDKSGSGLGLAICHALMEKMNGSIEAVKEPDGFCIILCLPLAQE